MGLSVIKGGTIRFIGYHKYDEDTYAIAMPQAEEKSGKRTTVEGTGSANCDCQTGRLLTNHTMGGDGVVFNFECSRGKKKVISGLSLMIRLHVI